MMKNVVGEAVPSITTVKKILLPGFEAPIKVNFTLMHIIQNLIAFSQALSPNGIPFYLRSPTVIIKGVFAVPDIAKNLIRYPVAANHEIRFPVSLIFIL